MCVCVCERSLYADSLTGMSLELVTYVRIICILFLVHFNCVLEYTITKEQLFQKGLK
jgi:hypothetical protein